MPTPLKLSDTTFRDAHQSLMATRLRTEDMAPLAEAMDGVGFHSMEVWGGATFDAATRFLYEDPWERLRTFKALLPNTPLSMLLRGQSLVGYRTYADDVVDAFVERAAANGIDVFRVFDALNYEPNLERAADAVKRAGKHLQLTICYTVTDEGRMGGDIYNLGYYVAKAKTLRDMGADSVCVKDMGGLLAPYDAYDLISALKAELGVPLQLHCHYTSGMASMSALKAAEAGLDILDVCLAPLALRTSQPAVEPIASALAGTARDPKVPLAALLDIGDRLEAVLPKYAEHMRTTRAAVIDARVLSHQIPGGMASNLASQLREADAIDRLDEVLAEIPRTRAELGYPPLVTPMSQMVGAQAVSNVLFGRYAAMSEPVKEYLRGGYGEPVSPPSAELLANPALADGEGEPASGAPKRPGAAVKPELDAAKESVSHMTDDIDDVLIYALYPQTGERFLRIKHGLEDAPTSAAAESAPPAMSPSAAPTPSDAAPPPSGRARRFNVYVGGSMYEVDVDPVGRSAGVESAPPARRAPTQSAAASQPSAAPPSAPSEPATAEGEIAVKSPMPGMLVSVSASEGDRVERGAPLLVLEAMKMQNAIPAPASGVVASLPVPVGTQVAREQTLAVIRAGEERRDRSEE